MKEKQSQWIRLGSPRALLLSLGLAAATVPGVWCGAAYASQSQSVTSAPAKGKVVKGQVTDENGEPLIGVTVQVAGGTQGTVTDIDGNFSVEAADGQELKFSYIGYEVQTVKVKGNAAINIKMLPNAENLQELVVVGYGTQKKETLTGAVTVVSDKMFENKGSLSSPLQALQGQVPGVIITRNSSAPGDESWGMKIRGASSMNTTAPLIVIDGVAYEDANALRNINSDDIQSINFLKDASAAIYGSRAAGGVVLITTKQAKAGKPKLEYSGSVTLKRVGLQPELMSLSEWANAVITARTNDGYGADDTWIKYARMALANQGKFIDFQHSANPFGAFDDTNDLCFFDTNWTDILFDDAVSTQHNVALSGGTEDNLYRASLGFLYDGSNLQWGDNNNKRYNFRLNNKINVTPWFHIDSNVAYNRQNQVAPTQIRSALTDGYPQPGLPAATKNGLPYSWGTWLSPVWYAERGGDNKLRVSEINISENLTFNLGKHVDLVGNVGYNSSSATRDIKRLAITSYNYNETIEYSGSGKDIPAVANPENSWSGVSNARTDFYSLTGNINYHNTWADKHNFKAMFGSQYELKEYSSEFTYVKNLQPALDVLNGSGEIGIHSIDGQGSSPTKWQEGLLSYFSRINYDFMSKYLLEVNMRYDGSSRFKTDRWKFFYGISGGWRLTEESFMRRVKWLNELKLRASYGQTGNQSGIDRYEGEQFYTFNSSTGAYLDNAKATYIDTNGKIASYDRTWERIHNYNIGVDFGLFDSRLTGTFEIYWKRNNNMLITVTYPGILGDQAGAANKGKFKANGYEFNVNWSDHIGDFHYHIGGNYTYANNELTDIGGTTVIRQGLQSTQQGYPLNSVFGLRYTGKIQNEEQRQKYLYRFLSGNTIGLTNEIRLGDNMFEDVNGDGKLTSEDLVYLGSDDPKISYSFNVGAEWKGFDLSLVFQGVAKRTIFRTGSSRWRIPMSAVYQNTSNQSVGKTWSTENPDAFYPTYTNNNTINNYNYQCSSWSVEDGSYLRLKNITLGYNFPKSLLTKLKVISALRLYVTGTDLWETSKINDGWDPEASRSVSGTGRYPFTRNFTVGMNLSF